MTRWRKRRGAIAVAAAIALAGTLGVGGAEANPPTVKTITYVAASGTCGPCYHPAAPVALGGTFDVTPSGSSISLVIDEQGLAPVIDVRVDGWWRTRVRGRTYQYVRATRQMCVPEHTNFTVTGLKPGAAAVVKLWGGYDWLWPAQCHDGRLANPWNARVGTVTVTY